MIQQWRKKFFSKAASMNFGDHIFICIIKKIDKSSFAPKRKDGPVKHMLS